MLLGKVTNAGLGSILFYKISTSTIEKEYHGNVDVGSSLQRSSDHQFIIIKERGSSRLVKLEADNTMTQKITTSHENLFFHPDDNTKVITGSELERAQGAVFVQDRESVVENIPTPMMTIMRLDVQSGFVFGPLTDGTGEYVAFDYKNEKSLGSYKRFDNLGTSTKWKLSLLISRRQATFKMKKVLLLIFCVVGSVLGLAQHKFSITVGTGLGTYAMGGPSALREHIRRYEGNL